MLNKKGEWNAPRIPRIAVEVGDLIKLADVKRSRPKETSQAAGTMAPGKRIKLVPGKKKKIYSANISTVH